MIVSEDHYRHDPAETRCKLLDVAERLFAEKGFEGTSVRDITTAAGCNVAAVNYHYGGKENLYREVFRRLLREHRQERIRRIRSDLQAAGEGATLEIFLESFASSFLEPLVEEGRGSHLMAVWDREMHNHHLEPEVFLDELIRPMMEVTEEALNVVGPELEPGLARLCMMSVAGQLMHAVKMKRMFQGSAAAAALPFEPESLVRHIVRFSAGGIRACAQEVHHES
jgi:AcrR family transcriptional regulator